MQGGADRGGEGTTKSTNVLFEGVGKGHGDCDGDGDGDSDSDSGGDTFNNQQMLQVAMEWKGGGPWRRGQ